MSKPRKPKICKVCKGEFMPYMTTQKVCDFKCALELVEIDKVRAFKRETLRLKKKIKSKAQWMKEAQAAFNKFIRLRDAGEPCISCGTTKQGIQYAAGHYLTRGAHPALRFNELNVHKQCNQYCNLQNSGNIAKYRPELVKKIGILQVEWLEGPHEAKNYTEVDLKEIKEYYKRKARALEKEKEYD